MRVGGQRMGMGLKGCMNINSWNHFFEPNSPSAQEGAEACFDHYARSSGSGTVKNKNTTRSNLEESVRYVPDGNPFSNMPSAGEATGTPDLKPVALAVLVLVAAYFIWKG